VPSEVVTLIGGAVGGAVLTGATNVYLALRADRRARRAVLRKLREELLDRYTTVRMAVGRAQWHKLEDLRPGEVFVSDFDAIALHLTDHQLKMVRNAYRTLELLPLVAVNGRDLRSDEKQELMLGALAQNTVTALEGAFEAMRPLAFVRPSRYTERRELDASLAKLGAAMDAARREII